MTDITLNEFIAREHEKLASEAHTLADFMTFMKPRFDGSMSPEGWKIIATLWDSLTRAEIGVAVIDDILSKQIGGWYIKGYTKQVQEKT